MGFRLKAQYYDWDGQLREYVRDIEARTLEEAEYRMREYLKANFWVKDADILFITPAPLASVGIYDVEKPNE